MTDDTDTNEAENVEDVQQKDTLDEESPEAADEGSDSESEPDEADTIVYKRADLEKLRQENGKYRQRAQQADDLAVRLHTELVRSTGRLADPTDLPFDEDHLADADKLSAAIDDLLLRKPHFASRRPIGDISQGPSPAAANVDLAAILRGKAG